jgi:hypothetical protein
MLIVYGACGESACAAVEAYAARFPANVFLRLVNRARYTGNLVPQTKGVGGVTREARTPQNDEAVLQAFEEDGTLSIRSVASMFDISKSTTQRILKDNRQHAYTRVYRISCLKIFLSECSSVNGYCNNMKQIPTL